MLFRVVCFALLIYFLIYTFHPDRFAAHYKYITLSNILSELEYLTIIKKEPNLEDCNYENNLINNSEIYVSQIQEKHEFHSVQKGGEYFPKTCNTHFSVAVVVPYRNRESQLKTFLNYFHFYLQKQFLHYRIFIVDQKNNDPFNRAKLFNIGANEAIKLKFPCLILQDIDLIPINSGNLYVCTKKPRHMSSSLDTFRFNLPYQELTGGAISITSNQFSYVNGMSNEFFGWGGEDDDFYDRLHHANLTPYRFSPKISRYIMLKHKKEKPSDKRYEILRSGPQRYKTDGLNSIRASYNITLKSLYTHINVYKL